MYFSSCLKYFPYLILKWVKKIKLPWGRVGLISTWSSEYSLDECNPFSSTLLSCHSKFILLLLKLWSPALKFINPLFCIKFDGRLLCTILLDTYELLCLSIRLIRIYNSGGIIFDIFISWKPFFRSRIQIHIFSRIKFCFILKILTISPWYIQFIICHMSVKFH